MSMRINQGDIFFADLNPVKGHEQAGLRPVLILQNNILNEFLSTVIIIPITSNLAAKGKLTTFFLEKKLTSLPKDSVALLFQIRTIDKERLVKKVFTLDERAVKEIKGQLKYIF